MLSRVALRLAALEALRPTAAVATGVFPTVAGPGVFDSRLDPIANADDLVAYLESNPLVVVYTEDHESEPAPNTQYPPTFEFVELSVEMLFAALDTAEAAGPYGSLTVAITDPVREAMLDLLEAQVRHLLSTVNSNPAGALFRSVAPEVRAIKSLPDRTPDRTTKYLRRTLRLRCKIRPDAWPPFAVSPAPAGFAALPEPLRTLAYALPAGGYGAGVCRTLAALVAQGPVAVPLTSVGLFETIFPSAAAALAAAPVAPAALAAETLVTPVTAQAVLPQGSR